MVNFLSKLLDGCCAIQSKARSCRVLLQSKGTLEAYRFKSLKKTQPEIIFLAACSSLPPFISSKNKRTIIFFTLNIRRHKSLFSILSNYKTHSVVRRENSVKVENTIIRLKNLCFAQPFVFAICFLIKVEKPLLNRCRRMNLCDKHFKKITAKFLEITDCL